MKAIALILASLLITIVATPAKAGTVINTVAGWDIIKEESSCSMMMEYEGSGSTRLIFGKSENVGIGLIVSNYNWSSKEGEEYDTHFVLNGTVYSSTAIGVKDSIWKGFVILMEDDFEKHLAQGTGLDIYLGKTLIDELQLKGSAAAIAAMNRCYARVKAENDAERREKAKWEHLPKDPFAKD